MTAGDPGAGTASRAAKAYVVGAGLAGLSAATILAARGVHVTVIEAAGQAGGRCRSYFDSALGGMIDNGNHLVLSGNRAVHDYLARVGAKDALAGPPRAEFAFTDLRDGKTWMLRPNEGALPWWAFSARRRVPDTAAGDYAAYAPLLWAGKAARIGDVVRDRGALWDRLMRPFLLAALNTGPEDASAALAGAVLRETLAKGGRHYRPRIAHPTLAAAFVDPALQFLNKKGAPVRFGTRLRAITTGKREAVALDLPDATVPLAPGDAVVLAVPPWAAADLIPGLTVPNDFRAIVNAHFRIAAPAGAPAMLGVIGGTAEWIFSFPDRISVTVSAADAIVDQDREELAARIWADVAKALGIASPLPAWQIVKEKRATFAATPAQDARRPAAATCWRNLFLAGDWTGTGLPATIEGALRSGETAAALALRHLSL
ncbi:MAG TPA: hydroxysqualene dehydroxylase HpnE [Rhizomicrobium sp.]|nr:hydroxysqualene dehydroxylase HpnE [Rhizomicrobium sp.]